MRQKGPDFLGVGMQKAGTGWIYDALCQVDGFEMLPVKEFHHFKTPKLRNETIVEPRYTERLRSQFKNRKSRCSDQIRDRFEAALDDYIANGFKDADYQKMFDVGNIGLSGDITPGYSVLDRDSAAAVHRLLPDIPVILLLRHPVDRLWSGFNMEIRRRIRISGLTEEDDVQAMGLAEASRDSLTAYVTKSQIARRSYPSAIHDAWSVYGENLIVAGFEDIIRQPKAVVEKVASKILGKPVHLPPDFKVENSKSTRPKVSMTNDHRALLYEVFAEELAICRQRFPDIAGDWKME